MEELRRLIDKFREEQLEPIYNVDIARETRSLGVIFLDIFRFKEQADRHGHSASDMALAGVGRVLQALAREGEIPCRYGGDEFLLIMPDVTEEEVQLRASELRQAESQMLIMSNGTDTESLTLSIGVAHYPCVRFQNPRPRLHFAEGLMSAVDEDLELDRERNVKRVQG